MMRLLMAEPAGEAEVFAGGFDGVVRFFAEQGQSPWLDNIRRGWITSGELEERVGQGVRGLTSNPSIFQKAIQGSAEYDDEFGAAEQEGLDVEALQYSILESLLDKYQVDATFMVSSTDGGLTTIG